jgi:type IV pilus assembly protein PilA
MNKVNRSSKGFTLVEIMIVVVIIGLLAAMAIPAFQKVRRNSVQSAMDNDARQIASAAQQYFMELSATQVTLNYTPNTGAIEGPLTEWVKIVGKNYATFPGQLGVSANFNVGHSLIGQRVYNPEGQFTGSTQ